MSKKYLSKANLKEYIKQKGYKIIIWGNMPGGGNLTVQESPINPIPVCKTTEISIMPERYFRHGIMEAEIEETHCSWRYKLDDCKFIKIPKSEYVEAVKRIERKLLYGFVVVEKKQKQQIVLFWEDNCNLTEVEFKILDHVYAKEGGKNGEDVEVYFPTDRSDKIAFEINTVKYIHKKANTYYCNSCDVKCNAFARMTILNTKFRYTIENEHRGNPKPNEQAEE